MSDRTYEIDVRWRDLDAMGHVNNAVYFTYLEEARLRWTKDLLAASEGLERPPGFIVASAKVDYRLPLFLGDRVAVAIRVAWFGRTSFGFAYEVRSRDQGALAATGETVQVTYDYAAKRPVPLDPAFRAAIEKFEARAIPERARSGGCRG